MRTLKLKKCKRVHGIYFTPDGSRLLAIGGQEVRMVDTAVWLDLASGENVGRIDQFAGAYAVSPDLSRLVLIGADEWHGIAPLQWTSLEGNVEWHPFPDSSPGTSKLPAFRDVSCLEFDRSGERVAVIDSRAIRRRKLSDSQRWEHELIVLRFDPIEAIARISLDEASGFLAFDRSGGRVATTGGFDNNDVSAQLFDLSTGKRVYRFDPPATVTRCVHFTPDGRLLVTNGRNVYVLPPDRPDPLFVLTGHTGQVNAVAIARDGHRILTASHDGAIRVWEAADGRPVASFDWQVGPVTAVAFAPDGLTCAAAALNGRVVVWDVE